MTDIAEDIAAPAATEPNVDALLDAVMARLGLKNDAALALALEVAPPVISKLRHRRLPLGPGMMIRIMEKTDLLLSDIKAFLATPLP